MQRLDILYVILLIILFFLFIRFVVYPLLYILLIIFIYLVPIGVNLPSLLIYYNTLKVNVLLYKDRKMREKVTLLNRLTKILPDTKGYIDVNGVVLIGAISEEQVANALNSALHTTENMKDYFMISHFVVIIQAILFILLLVFGKLNGTSMVVSAIISSALGYVLGLFGARLLYVKSIESLTIAGVRMELPPKFFVLLGLPFRNNLIRIDVR